MDFRDGPSGAVHIATSSRISAVAMKEHAGMTSMQETHVFAYDHTPDAKSYLEAVKDISITQVLVSEPCDILVDVLVFHSVTIMCC